MEIIPLKTALLESKFNLLEALKKSVIRAKTRLRDGDVVVISSKIVALSQGRLVDLRKVKLSANARRLFKKIHKKRIATDPRVLELAIRESQAVFPAAALLTLKDNMLVPAAGIDLSNVPKNFAILWPENPWQAVGKLRQTLRTKLKIKKLGLVICDSQCHPLRWGTIGLAVAWAGFDGVEDARGQKDIFGKKLVLTRKAVADNLSSGALLVMGEAAEKIPFALIRGAKVNFTNRRQREDEIFVKPEDDIFGGIYSKKALRLMSGL